MATDPYPTERPPGDDLAEKMEQQMRRDHPEELVWHCPQCGYKPNVDTLSETCQNCGADFLGMPGKAPVGKEKEPRAGLRSDITEY